MSDTDKHPLDDELHYYTSESLDEVLLRLVRSWKHLSLKQQIILAEYAEYLALRPKKKIGGFRLN